MTHTEFVQLFLALAVLLAASRLLGESARKLNQPAVLGELMAGILLGPTLLGWLAPDVFGYLFPTKGMLPVVMQGFTTVGITLFLLVAGLEVDLSAIFRQGRSALTVSLSGILIPGLIGFGLGWAGPLLFGGEALGRGENAGVWLFALFFATAMSISALPVIAKTLMDLNLYRSDLGMTVIASAVFDDLVGWIIFALLLGMMGMQSHEGGVGLTMALVAGYVIFMLTIGRWALHRLLPIAQAHMSWPGGVLGMAVALAFAGAALAEWMGVHAIFGAFIVGVALGDSAHLRERTRSTLEQFVTFIFAPIFFATLGLRVNFVQHFDLALVATVLVIACTGKLVGCAVAARSTGLPRRESWAIGAAMNARGAMEIILALLALNAGLITERLFVALVIMALVTSVIAGPLMQRILRRKKARRFTSYVGARSFIADLKADSQFAAIMELANVSGVSGVSAHHAAEFAMDRERVVATGIGQGIALPHARIPGLAKAQAALGISRRGIDFNAPDGEPARIIVLILTPENDDGLLLELYRDVISVFRNQSVRDGALKVRNYTELLALLASVGAEAAPAHGAAEPAARPEASKRGSVVIVGASATARALAKVLGTAQRVVLIDSNAARAAAARADGLEVVEGNALDPQVLAQGGAAEAGRFLCMTTNAEINLLAARTARESFQVPDLHVVQTGGMQPEDKTLKALGAGILFAGETTLGDWDQWFERGEAEILRRPVSGASADQALAGLGPSGDLLVMALERPIKDGRLVMPWQTGMSVQAGDTLVLARVKPRPVA